MERNWTKILLLFIWALFSTIGHSYESESSERTSEDGSVSETILESGESSGRLPEWLKRVYYGLKIKSDRKPLFYFETVQPFWTLTEDRCLVLIQPRISIKDGRENYSLGLGYRQLFGQELVILGLNTFFDYEDRESHSQIGFGGEVLSDYVEARINSYFGTSSDRLVAESATSYEYEEVVDGLDAEIGIRVPGLPWLKVFGGGYYYDANYADDLEGWKTRLELKPLSFLTIDLGLEDDNASRERWFIEVEFRMPFGKEDFSFKEVMDRKNVKKIALHTRLLDPVERNFIPTVEKWISDRTGTVTGKILDQNNNPVINAKVEIHSEVVTAFTDSGGEFTASVTLGDHVLFAWNSSGDQIINGKAITVTDGTTLNLGTEIVDNPSANHAPVITNLTALPSTITGPPRASWVSFDAADADGGDITWSASITGFIPEDPDDDDQGRLAPPSGGTINNGSGSKQVRYLARDSGTVTITVSLDDGNGGTDSESISIVVDQ